MQKWSEFLEYMKRKDEKENMGGDVHQHKVEQMIKSAEGSAGLLYKITKPMMLSGGVQILEKDQDDARLLDRCEVERKEVSKHWQCDEEVQSMQDKPWRTEELRKCEEALPRLRRR